MGRSKILNPTPSAPTPQAPRKLAFCKPPSYDLIIEALYNPKPEALSPKPNKGRLFWGSGKPTKEACTEGPNASKRSLGFQGFYGV